MVLARALHLVADGALDDATIIRRLAEDADARTYFVDLSAAGGEHTGTALVGASPELLVARRAELVTCRPFAGSAPRSGRSGGRPGQRIGLGGVGEEPTRTSTGRRRGAQGTRAALRRPADRAGTRTEPHVDGVASQHADLWAYVRESSTTALDLAVALHPTPAVGGVPRDASHRTHQRTRRATAASTRARSAGAMRPATARGWCRSGAPCCRRTGAAPSHGRAAASSPNPIPTTKSPRPRRSSEPSCPRWG